ncbi:hypothetical protein ACFPTX_12330 [Pseudomonas sp. GCM10022188]|uniref:hypothetical protein n=1 Tax=Pseudomonas TaxID=286 RepID=UPI001E592C11|nr:hypothetical protein [Pseudomonas oryzagri]MCC6074778.1 hypothetical protein [Pseudomonas oryzagri]
MGSRQRRSLPSHHAILLAAAVLSGCALQPPAAPDACGRAFARLRSATAAVRDAQYHPLADFPGLRSDRVLAVLAVEATSPAARRLWLQRLADNDREAAAIERGNLAAGERTELPEPALLEGCRRRQVESLANDIHSFARAAAAARIPSDYRPWARTLGLYPLLRPLYRRSIAAWQREAAAQQAPADTAAWLSYRLAEPLGDTPPPPLRTDVLGLPQATAEQLAALFARHAPELRIAAQSAADRPGAPLFDRRGRRGFARDPALVYRRHAWSRLDGRWHLQLIYQWWFSERPASGVLDLYAGELDGLLWRVTLDERGQAILFDAIHPCGCWHALFLPADSPLQFRQPADAEQRLARRLTLAGRQAATLWLRAGDHALLWVDGRRAPYPIHRYRLAELDELRRLPHPAGRRSLYGSDGLVPGSQRLERWILWPSGVVSPGAMRQWGRHASAFVGEAHFDDPDLLGRYFHTPK